MFKDISQDTKNGHEIIVEIFKDEYFAVISLDLDEVILYFGLPNQEYDTKRFDNMRCFIQYMRLIRFDSATNFDMLPYVEEILTKLYLTKLVTASDILGKCY
jgi:hypothetical protein